MQNTTNMLIMTVCDLRRQCVVLSGCFIATGLALKRSQAYGMSDGSIAVWLHHLCTLKTRTASIANTYIHMLLITRDKLQRLCCPGRLAHRLCITARIVAEVSCCFPLRLLLPRYSNAVAYLLAGRFIL